MSESIEHIADEAKAAFAFRDVPVVEASGAADLVGIRSSATLDAHRVERNDTSLLWSIEDGLLTGVLDADDVVAVHLQTKADVETIDVDFIGTFELTPPTQSFRFVIDADSDVWATSWLN